MLNGSGLVAILSRKVNERLELALLLDHVDDLLREYVVDLVPVQEDVSRRVGDALRQILELDASRERQVEQLDDTLVARTCSGDDVLEVGVITAGRELSLALDEDGDVLDPRLRVTYELVRDVGLSL
jgi:hypothetical protein